jgi:hypothetical protein
MELTLMSRGFRQFSGRALCLLAILGLLAATPGCGDGGQKETTPSGIPKNVQESNKNMEEFMKSQQKK